MIKKVFLEIYRKLTFNGILNFDREPPNVDEWRNFLNSIPEPKDDLEQSYAKYRARMHYFSAFYIVLANISAIFAFIFSINIFSKKHPIDPIGDKFLLVKADTVHYNDIIPNDIYETYGASFDINKPNKSDWYLSNQAKNILKSSFKKYPFKFYFNFMLFKELAMYSTLVDRFKPNAIVTYVNERNIASPILTKLFEENGVEYISFMHGEYLLNLIQAYMKFSKFYVWDEHYIDMFENYLNCTIEEYPVYTPKKYSNDDIDNSNADYFITYYFGAESSERIKNSSEIFKALKANGFKCKIRPHPRRSNIEAIYEAFSDFEIENTEDISIEKSLSNTQHAVGLSSTVLSEALHGGVSVILDDISEPKRFKSLEDRKYILLESEHELLSNLIKRKLNN